MKRLPWLLLPLGVLAADFASKVWILSILRFPGDSRPVIEGFFSLTLGFNKGAIFGTLNSAPEWLRIGLFSLAGIAALVYFGRLFLADETPKLERMALGLILGGACGNGLDRILHGHVVDFLDFVFGTWHYWYFNLADSCIVVGAILFGIALLTVKKAGVVAPSE
ncbi:MAG: signal peptidase II [Acidobacteriota bacterium]|nr:signal peptidase II [Acidobacteriota bacterium]